MHRTIHGEQNTRTGDTFVLRPGAWHAYAKCCQLEVYNCCFSSELLQRELVWLTEEPTARYLLQREPVSSGHGTTRLQLSGESLQRCLRRLDAIGCASGHNAPAYRMDLIGHLLLLLSELAVNMSQHHQSLTNQKMEVHPIVERGIKLFEDSLAYQWSLLKFSSELAMDRSYITRLFKEHTGLPPMKYLARHRAEVAATLLLRTDLSIAQVGEKVGWSDPNYFARRFKAHFGSSATAYRDKLYATSI